LEGVIDEVSGRIVAGKDIVEGQDRSAIQFGLGTELAAYFLHVPVVLFEESVITIEHRVEGSLIAGEVCGYEFFKRGGGTVLVVPEFRDLLQAALSTCTLSFAIFVDEGLFRLRKSRRHPRQR